MKKLFKLLATTLLTVSMASCGDDTPKDPTFDDLTMFAGETTTIKNLKDYEWESENIFIANIEDNVLSALRVGTTTIKCEKASFDVTVNPNYNVYAEPYMEWGASLSKVKSFMKGHAISYETEEGIVYYGKHKEDYISYIFDEYQRLTSAGVVIAITTVEAEELVGFLEERYIYYDNDGEVFYFFSVDLTDFIALSVHDFSGDIYYMVTYMGYEENARSTAEFRNIFDRINAQPLNNEFTKELSNLLSK